jgi:hypothetical protein
MNNISHGQDMPIIKEIQFPPQKCVYVLENYKTDLSFVIPLNNLEAFLTYSSKNVPVIIMINQPTGNMIYSFGFDFSKTSKNSIITNKQGKFETILIRKSFVNAQTGITSNIKNIYGLSNTIDHSNDE